MTYKENINKPKMTVTEAGRILGVSGNAIRKQIQAKNLPSFKYNNQICFGHNAAKEIFKKFMIPSSVISFQIVKGGTGKTSLATNLAIRASLYGLNVLCLDLDQQGNMTQSLQVECRNHPVLIDIVNEKASINDSVINIADGLDIIPSRIENAVLDNVLMLGKKNLNKVYYDIIYPIRKEYDLIVIDCPPSIGQSVSAATLISDVVVMPVSPEQFSLTGLNISLNEIDTLCKSYDKSILTKIILNKFDKRTALSDEVLETLINDSTLKNYMFKNFIGIHQEIPNAIYSGKTLFQNTIKNDAKEDIDLFTTELLQYLRKAN